MSIEFSPDGSPVSYLLDRTFHIAKENAGFLGLGVGIQVLIDGQVSHEEVVYGNTLHLIRRHVDSQVSGDSEKMLKTNNDLPKRFQYTPELAALKLTVNE